MTRRSRRPVDPVLAARVRQSLVVHAQDAPDAEPVADRVLAAAATSGRGRESRQRPVTRPPAPRRYLLPALAAAVVVAAVGVAVLVTHDDTPQTPAAAHGTRSVIDPTPAPSASPTAAAAVPPTSAGDQVVKLSSLTHVTILDVTFSGSDDGWALASADCLSSAGRCTALLHTTDGDTWQSHPDTPFNVAGVNDCSAPCVTGIRFATDQVGYAYGPSALFMTTTGGDSWVQQAGGALALETADQNVVRLTSTGSGCPGPCGLGVSTAAVGSSVWTPGNLTGVPSSVGSAELARNGPDVYVLVLGNPAGGAGNATSTLIRSTDGGASWSSVGEPCPQPGGGESDSVTLGAATGGQLAVVCRNRMTGAEALAVSSNAGAGFTAAGALPGAATVVTASGTGTFLAGGTVLWRSIDGGQSWSQAARVTGPVTFAGFESDVVARVVGGNGSIIWATHDGGATFLASRFQ